MNLPETRKTQINYKLNPIIRLINTYVKHEARKVQMKNTKF